MQDEFRTLTVPEAADLCNVPRKVVYGWLRNGLAHVQMPGESRPRILARGLREWIERNTVKISQPVNNDRIAAANRLVAGR